MSDIKITPVKNKDYKIRLLCGRIEELEAHVVEFERQSRERCRHDADHIKELEAANKRLRKQAYKTPLVDILQTYAITPVPKPRQTRSDQWKVRPAVARYRAFADECRLLMGDIDLDGKTIIFHMPMPRSWTLKKKREMDCQLHRQRPDIDNLGKSLLDAIYGDDSHIADIRLVKRWAGSGSITVRST